MPASASASARLPEDLITRLSSATDDGEAKLMALRELKNQIIGSRTKKLSYVKLGAVPSVVSILADGSSNSLLVQSAAAIGSFACGFDAGVKAVLDAGAFPHLFSLISHSNDKVVDARAHSLKIIYQSKLAPKYDFFQERNMKFLLSLLNSENENVTGLGESIITHSCETSIEQKALSDAGALERLVDLLGGSLCQRDASLESLPPQSHNPGSVSTKDRYPQTRLLACMCLIVVRNTSPSYLQDVGTKTKLILILLELLDGPGLVGDEAAFSFSSLIAEKEDLQKLVFEANVVLNLVTDLLNHDSANVRAAACICLRSVSCSVKNLSAGSFMNEVIVLPLIKLLHGSSTYVQVAALGVISNIVVNFTTPKSAFMQCGGVKQLAQLSKSMESTVRVNAVWALRNLMFLKDHRCKEEIFLELTASTLASLICDPEPSVQEQALGLVRNLVHGCIDSVEYVFADDALILHAVGRQLQTASKAEVLIEQPPPLTLSLPTTLHTSQLRHHPHSSWAYSPTLDASITTTTVAIMPTSILASSYVPISLPASSTLATSTTFVTPFTPTMSTSTITHAFAVKAVPTTTAVSQCLP
ncbi:Armadillo repeat-containing protein 8 [Camellia lanceoleosa]|uniref:Armadillo repeat-containing protein 8 n=1 Tax=Camellia lanceoleosa TaxID=1840588 RepID=A0ACC0F7K8_9ERIC|nr:Armadillo repeat-containing protein 8 [Camellia lanceoleosa]